MIFLFTDFGFEGPYVGQIKAVLAAVAPGQTVIDLMHDAPAGRPGPSGYLLASLMPALPDQVVVVAVVDPGVGGPRAPLIARLDGRYLVGPDNGLMGPAAVQAARAEWWEITWQPAKLSASFHGRDLFAPVAGRLARGEAPESLGRQAAPVAGGDWPADVREVVYIDGFGNAMLGLRAGSVAASARILLNEKEIFMARTFSDVAPGTAFWYANSNGLVEIAVNGGSAARTLGLSVGDAVTIDG